MLRYNRCWENNYDVSELQFQIQPNLKVPIVSLLSSLVIDYLLDTSFSTKTVGVVYLYCDYGNRNTQNPDSMMRLLLKQAIEAVRNLGKNFINLIDPLFEQQERGKLDLEDVCKFLVQSIAKFTKSYLCIDALDECGDGHRGILLPSLRRVLEGCDDNTVRLFLTGRPQVDQNINRHLKLGGHPVITSIMLEANADDIPNYVLHSIEMNEDDESMNESLKNDIMDRILQTSEQMLVLTARTTSPFND